jgi:hypothetical protein
MNASQSGHTAVEYLVVCGALAFALFVPITDSVSPGGARTTVQIVLAEFQTAYKNISHAMSLPN